MPYRELIINKIINNSELIIPVEESDNCLHIKWDYMTREDLENADNVEIGGIE